MYKALNETEIKTGTQIGAEYPGMAYIMLNPTNPVSKGVVLESRGQLYAIADDNGVDQLFKEASALRKQGKKIMIDTTDLDSVCLHTGYMVQVKEENRIWE